MEIINIQTVPQKIASSLLQIKQKLIHHNKKMKRMKT